MKKSDILAYKAWRSMKSRCLTKSHSAYNRYKNVIIDPAWLKFENFYSDMGDKPNSSYCLDRIDPTKGYNKDNCRWITLSDNSRLATFKHGLSRIKGYGCVKRYKKLNKPIPKYKLEQIKDIFDILG